MNLPTTHIKSLSFKAWFLLIFCSCTILHGQNIIVNGGFEDYEQCPIEEANFVGFVSDWLQFDDSTPNYLNCDYLGNVFFTDA